MLKCSLIFQLWGISARFGKKDGRLFVTHYLSSSILGLHCSWLAGQSYVQGSLAATRRLPGCLEVRLPVLEGFPINYKLNLTSYDGCRQIIAPFTPFNHMRLTDQHLINNAR